MKIISPEVRSTVVVRAPVEGVEPIEVSAGGTVFLHPNSVEVVYTSNITVWEVVVTVTAILSLSRTGVEGSEWCWAAAPMYWRGGSTSRPNLDKAPEWVRVFVERNVPIMLAAERRIG